MRVRAAGNGRGGAGLIIAAVALSACAPSLRQTGQQGQPTRPPGDNRDARLPDGTTTDGGQAGQAGPPRAPGHPRFDGTQPLSERPEWMRALQMPDIPLRWYPRVTQFLEQYRSEPRSREIIRGWLRRFTAHRAVMEAALAREGLPKGLTFVAMIESGFTASAMSSRGAGGFWQFRPAVARAYGLEVSFWVDERRDLEKSTAAAAKYLSDLYHRFGTWELALAGYNAGPFAVLESISRFNTNDYGTLCRVEAGLPWETTEYVPKVLAVAIVEKNRRAFGLDEAAPAAGGDGPAPFEAASVPPATSFEALAARTGVKAEDLAQLNPAFVRGRTPPDRDPVVLRFPPGKTPRLTTAALTAQNADVVATVVRPGETLVRLAKARKISAERLRRLNAVLDDTDVTPGTMILVPRTRSARPTEPAAPLKGRRSPP